MKAIDFLKFVEQEGISNAQYSIIDISKSEPVFRTLRDTLKIRYITRCVQPSLLDMCPHEQTASYVVYFPREFNDKTFAPQPWDLDARALLRLFNQDSGNPDGVEDLDCIPFACVDENGILMWISKLY